MLPLTGITVVALEQAVAAPLATRHLADCARILDAHWDEMARATQLTADAIATRTTLVLAERSLHGKLLITP